MIGSGALMTKSLCQAAPLQIQRREETLARFGIPAGGQLAVTEVALVVTIGEPGCDFPQVSLADRLTAQRTEGLWARCPAIDQNELHAVTLNRFEGGTTDLVMRLTSS